MAVNEVGMEGGEEERKGGEERRRGKEERKGAISQRTMLILGRCRCYFLWIQLICIIHARTDNIMLCHNTL